MKYYMGIDPGKTGGIAVIDSDGYPEVAERYSKDIVTMSDRMREIVNDYSIELCVLEKVGAMPKQGVTSMFNFGVNFGMYLGILAVLSIPHVLVPPRTWQRECLDAGTGETKERSLSMARRLFPSVDMKYKADDGIADALHMARYAKNYK